MTKFVFPTTLRVNSRAYTGFFQRFPQTKLKQGIMLITSVPICSSTTKDVNILCHIYTPGSHRNVVQTLGQDCSSNLCSAINGNSETLQLRKTTIQLFPFPPPDWRRKRCDHNEWAKQHRLGTWHLPRTNRNSSPMWKIVSVVCGKCSLFNKASCTATILSYMNETGMRNLDITFVLSTVSSVNLCMVFVQYVTCVLKNQKVQSTKLQFIRKSYTFMMIHWNVLFPCCCLCHDCHFCFQPCQR